MYGGKRDKLPNSSVFERLEDVKSVHKSLSLSSRCRQWNKPPHDHLKVNIDAAFFTDSNETELGVMIFDDRGKQVISRTLLLVGNYRPEEGEAIMLFEALSWIKDMSLERVIIEMDAKMMVDALNMVETDNSSFGDINESCHRLLTSYSHCKVQWINRDANSLAHKLVRSVRNFFSPHYWVEPLFTVNGSLDSSCSS